MSVPTAPTRRAYLPGNRTQKGRGRGLQDPTPSGHTVYQAHVPLGLGHLGGTVPLAGPC